MPTSYTGTTMHTAAFPAPSPQPRRRARTMTLTALALTAALALGTVPAADAAAPNTGPSPTESTSYLPGEPSLLAGAYGERKMGKTGYLEPVTDQVVVRFAEGVGAEAQASIAAGGTQLAVMSAGVMAEHVRPLTEDTAVLRLSRDLTEEEQLKLTAELEANPQVLYAEPDYRVVDGGVGNPGNPPNDPLWYTQWNMKEANVPAAWNHATGAGVIIGVADEGTRYHPDLTPQEIRGYDFVSIGYSKDGDGWDPDPTDPGDWSPGTNSLWHGMHVAGIAAARTGNGIGIAGVAPDARIQHTRVMGLNGLSYISDYAAGLLWSAGIPVAGVPNNPTPADVVNFSEAVLVASCPAVVQDAINRAHARNVPIVVAAGNHAVNAWGATPANCPGAIVVGATGVGKRMTGYSNWGSALDLLAPGGANTGGVMSTVDTGKTYPVGPGYGYMTGTSMAAPHVAGTIALMKQRNRSLTVEQIRTILRTHSGGNVNGYPFLNTAAAVAAVAPTYSVRGAIGAHYYATGGERVNGRPLGNEFPTRLGGAAQNFANHRTIYWSPATRAQTVIFDGAIGKRFAAAGFEHGYGYPVTAETVFWHGAKQHFRNGSESYAIYWSKATGARVMKDRGAIFSLWAARGDVNGFGFPTTDEQTFWHGARQFFTRNGRTTAVYWAPESGAHSMNAQGAIYAKWAAEGDAKTYGFPLNDEVMGAHGVVTVKFSKGRSIHWSAARGTWVS